MFGRSTESAPAAQTAPQPRRGRVAAKDARIFNEGRTFAERKAQADAERAVLSRRRLASLGATEFQQRNQRNGNVEYLPAELFYDVDRPNDRFVVIEGMPGMHALNSGDGRHDDVTRLPGKVTRRPGPSGLTPEAVPDPAPRPV